MLEKAVTKLLQFYISESIPEYIVDSARHAFSNESNKKMTIDTGDPIWTVEFPIQDEDFQLYTPKLMINHASGHIESSCNCENSFAGACTHVAATALAMLKHMEESLAASEHTPQPIRSTWKQTFRSFFSSDIDPEVGKYYLVYRIYPEPDRLQVAFFRARQNKSGLSTVLSEITLQQLVDNPDFCELSPELPEIANLIGQSAEYFGHRVTIPDELVTGFLWAIRAEHYVFWEESDFPCTITTRTLQLRLRPVFTDEQNLTIDILLNHEGKAPINIGGEDCTFHGQTPIWISWKRTFYPVYTTINTRLIKDLVANPLVVPNDELSEFLDKVWSKLPSSALVGQEEFIEQMEPYFVPAEYNPKLFLDEEGSLLTLHIENIYVTEHGEYAQKGPNPDMQTDSYQFEDTTYLIKRDQAEEAAITNLLLDMKFQPRNSHTWFLEPEEAITFLLDVYPSLVQRYRVYGEAALNRYKVRLSNPVINAAITSDEKEKWFNLDIEVNYDGQNIALEKIWKAWIQGKRYIQLKDGSYTSLPEAWLEKISHKLQALGYDPEKAPKKQFAQFEAPVLDSLLEDLPDVATDSFWDSLQEKLHTFKEITPIPPPKGLQATLRGYQLQGLAYLNFLREYNFGGILADEMGLGKTVQTLSFIQHVVESGNKGPNLIIVPTSVLPNWEREAKKFVPDLKLLTIYGPKREALFKDIPNSQLVLTTYALLRRNLEDLEKHEFVSIILDEAQNIKNPNTITARSVRRIQADMRLCLSGTPIENNLFELWSLFEFLMPGFLGAQHAFKRGIIKPIKDGDDDTLAFLRTRVRPFILRRTKNEVAKDLPPKIENTYFCGLTDEQAELYGMLATKLRGEVLSSVDEKGIARSQMSILDALLKLRQICCHPRLLKIEIPGVSTNIPSGKFDAFKDMVTDIIEEGHRVLVFSQFVQMLHIIRSWLQINEIPFCYLDGTSKDRFDQVDRFNNTPEIPIFLISLKAGGTGLNLTSADYVIHYDPWWNPAVEAQATDRTHRIGQTKQVFSYKLICQNTVEEKILQLQESKKGIADSIVPGAQAWKSISREDLEMLFDI